MDSRTVSVDDRTSIELTVSLRPDAEGGWIALDFDSNAGRHEGHDLTFEQAELFLEAFTEIFEAARNERAAARAARLAAQVNTADAPPTE